MVARAYDSPRRFAAEGKSETTLLEGDLVVSELYRRALRISVK